MKIPFVDLKTQYISIRREIDTAISAVIADSAFIGGARVRDFEVDFARAHEVKHCIGVANGTDALYILMKMLGVGVGDEIITVANSWISTSETISQTGATPVFVDVDQYFNIDTDLISAAITDQTKAILPVHLFGQPANLDVIVEICLEHGLIFMEDCAQAHFARFGGQLVGSFGIAGTFSFYPGKNLGAYGDAGAIVTNDDALAEKCRMYASHGALKKHEHQIEGINSRLDALQAAVLSAKLGHLDEWTRKRKAAAQAYTDALADIDDLLVPATAPGRTHVFHLYVVRTSRRNELREHLNEHGIQTGIHYPTALPLLPAYDYLGHIADQFPNAARYQNEILSLPMYPELSIEQTDYVVSVIRDFFNA